MSTKLLYAEAFFYLGYAKVLITRPFSKVVEKLSIQMAESSRISYEANQYKLRQVSESIEVASRNTFWQCKCLVRAIAAMKMLERRKMDSTMYLGTAKDDQGKLIAHAWLRCGNLYITGAENKDEFTTVGKFAKIVAEKG